MDAEKREALLQAVTRAGQFGSPGGVFWRDEAVPATQPEHCEISEISDTPETAGELILGETSAEAHTLRLATVRLLFRALYRDRAKTLARVVSARLKVDPFVTEILGSADLTIRRELALVDQIGDYDQRAESLAALDLEIAYCDIVDLPEDASAYTIERVLGGVALSGSETDRGFEFDIERPE